MQPDRPLELRTEGVGKRHGRQWILRGIDLQVPAGGALAILGSNGSGKSSLLRILCGFDEASEGSLEWHAGNDHTRAPCCRVTSPTVRRINPSSST